MISETALPRVRREIVVTHLAGAGSAPLRPRPGKTVRKGGHERLSLRYSHHRTGGIVDSSAVTCTYVEPLLHTARMKEFRSEYGVPSVGTILSVVRLLGAG